RHRQRSGAAARAEDGRQEQHRRRRHQGRLHHQRQDLRRRGGRQVQPVTPALELRGVTKRYGHVAALTEVDFTVHAGEVVALVGDNGAGKSTLVKAIAGSHRIDGGEILIDGGPVVIGSPTEASALGIETVYQDLALCDNLDVTANLYLGRER